ncbi:MAG: hypothetical protein EHM13_04755, partial [Acidobacteria bacterium]
MISVKLALVSIAALAALAAPAGAAAQVPESVEPTRFDLTVTADRLSLDEIGRLVPAIRDYTLPPGFRISSFVASGPLEELSMEFRVVSDRSSIDGNIVADVTAPRRAVNGVVEMDSFNLARLLERPSLPTSVTGRATIDLVFQEQGAATRIYGEYRVEGAEVSVEGLHATGVSAQGRLAGDRVHVDRASANLYGGAVTASGFATLPGRSQPLGYEFSGRARGVNLERLPARLRAPAVSTDLAFDYRVSSAGGGPEGQVKFERSRAAGAIVEPGTTARFSLAGEGPVSYSAEGRLSGADLRQIGRELGLEALQQPRFRGLINARFALEGRGATLGPVCATLTDSRLFGGTVPGMELRVSMDGEGLRFDAVGEFASIDPAVVLQSEDTLEAIFSGKLNVRGSVARIRDFDARDLVVEGEATLGEGRLRGIAVDAATVKGRYANRLVELEGLTVRGPDLALTASGDVALGEGAVSALDFTLRTPRLQALAEPFGVAAHGALETAGRLTGPVGELRLEGKLSASDLAYSAASAGKVSADYNVMVPSLDLARSEVGAEVRANRLALGGRHF